MLCWALNADFTKQSLRAKVVICFHDMPVETRQKKMKTVYLVYAQTVSYVPALCREGNLDSRLLKTEMRPG